MTTRTPRAGRATAFLAVPTLLLALTACSGDDEDGGEDPAPSPSATQTGAVSPPDLPTPPDVTNAAGAAQDVTFDATKCATDAGEQTASGTLKNPTKRVKGYRIIISWTNETSDTLGLGYEVVRGVEPGEEREWEVTADVADGATQCVLNALRGSIPK